MKKILFVNHTSVIGGASWCLFDILRHLDRDRFEPVVLLNEHGPLLNRIKSLNIPVIVDPQTPEFPVYAKKNLRGLKQFLTSILNLLRFKKNFFNHCKTIAPDVVYLNTSAQLFLPPIAKKAGIKKVIYHNREHWNKGSIFNLKIQMRNWITHRFVDHIFSITECGAKTIGFPEKTTVVRDWPTFDDETEIDLRKKLNIPADQFILLLTGGFYPMKGTKDLLQAVKLMKNQSKVTIIVLACSEWETAQWKQIIKKILGISSYAHEVKQEASTLDRIFLLPPTLQIKTYLQQCNVLVAPFIMPHAAKAAIEAQQLKKPVVIYDNEEAQEYVQHEKTGLIVPKENIPALAQALDDLVQNPKKAQQMGLLGHSFVTDQFGVEMNMKKIENYLEK